MTAQMALVLAILAAAFVLLVTEWLRMDLVALLVLGGLAVSGLVTPTEALSGFSNPAVVTVWAVFILSAGLTTTGVASLICRPILRLTGQSELRLIVGIMLTAGLLSAFLNNVGVAALLLPVVMDLARRTGRPPSRLLLPLAYGALLGGLTTLIGTPPNILASNALRDYGLQPFQLFDYSPVGLVVFLTGVAFMALIGRYLLPARDITREASAPQASDLSQLYDFRERLCYLHLPKGSLLEGKTLAESRLGSALKLNVIAIQRDGHVHLAPAPGDRLQGEDRLLVGGRLDQLAELHGKEHLVLKEVQLAVEWLVSSDVDLAEVQISQNSSLIGQTIKESGFRRRFGAIVLAILRGGVPQLFHADEVPLQASDILLVQGPTAELKALEKLPEFDSCNHVSDSKVADTYGLQERLVMVRIPRESILVGRSLAESRLAESFSLTVLGILRDGKTELVPSPFSPLRAGDTLLVKGNPEDLVVLRGLQEVEIEREDVPDLPSLESENIGLAEVVLSPHTTLDGKSLHEIHFREKYGLSVLALWRDGRAHRSDLADRPLHFGDALLVYGLREKIKVLGSEPDFLVLTQAAQQAPRLNKAPVAALVMLGVLVPVLLGWLPIAIAAVIGASLMVLTGALKMEEAYRYIEWQAVFLIAGMLPLGTAMQQTGTAQFLAERVVGLVGDFGPLAVMSGIFVLTSLCSQVMPNAAVTVLMAPIALSTANEMTISPFALMMVVALAASSSFLSPVAHPANSLVMGPGGYRFKDYFRVGLPLTLVVFGVVVLVLPIVWPIHP